MKTSKVGFIKYNVSLMNDHELKGGETLVYGALVSFRNMSIQSNTRDGQGEIYAYPPIFKYCKDYTSIRKKCKKSYSSFRT